MKLSVCITLKNRADFMRGKLDELCAQDYPTKDIEVCVTDGGSTDGLIDLLKSRAHQFDRITYAVSDRSKLPFRVPYNNPACDINAQVCHVATHHKIIRTDAEVRFQRKDTLSYISRVLTNRKGMGLTFTCLRMKPEFDVTNPKHFQKRHAYVDRISNDGFFCVCFDRRDFIKRSGVEETFALGFAAEDSYFHWWWKRNGWLVRANKQHRVMHLYHGEVRSLAATRTWKEYTLPLYTRMKRYTVPPNAANPYWRRREMLGEIQTWTS